MKNLKLNKLAENRLNEKEMRNLTGGGIVREWNIVCDKEGVCCTSLCSCSNFSSFISTVSDNGVSSASSSQYPLA